MKKLFFSALTLMAMAIFVGCAKDNDADGAKGGQFEGAGFDYKMTEVYNLKVNLDLKGYADKVIFEIYAEDPYNANGTLKSGVEPVLQAFADKTGKYNGQVMAPKYAEKLYLRSSYPGIPHLMEAAINGATVTFDRTAAVYSAAASVRAAYTYPAWVAYTLGEWDANGRPAYLNAAKATVPAGLMDFINGVLPDEQSLPAGPNSQLLDGTYKTLKIREKATSVDIVFLHCGGMYKNSVGYYTFTTGTEPTLATIKPVLVFPSATYDALEQGHAVRLKYFNGTAWQDEFPANTTIGFFTIVNAFGAGNVANNSTFYSNYTMVNGQMQQMVAFYNTANQVAVLGIEDMDRASGNSDQDFNDVIFYVESTPKRALDPTPDPTPDPNPPTETITHYYGTLIYEDLWPNRGDYDINDMIVEYSCYVHQNKDGLVTKIRDHYKPVHNGAQIQSAFAIQYGFRPGEGRVTYFDTDYPFLPTDPDQGKDYQAIPWETAGGYFETGQTYANIKLFDDIRKAKYTRTNYNWNIHIEFDTPIDIRVLTYPPYNPYAIIKPVMKDTPAEIRERELHLASTTWFGTSTLEHKLYPPTDKANAKWFGTYWDHSEPAKGIYYISNDNYPFAINIPYQHSWKFQDVEKQNIEVLYPEFSLWATSHGYHNKQWFRHPSR